MCTCGERNATNPEVCDHAVERANPDQPAPRPSPRWPDSYTHGYVPEEEAEEEPPITGAPEPPPMRRSSTSLRPAWTFLIVVLPSARKHVSPTGEALEPDSGISGANSRR